MACATPVITTSQAVAPLSAVPEQDLLVADDADNFARTILKLLADSQLQYRLGESGRAYVENHHNWRSITTKLVEIYRAK